MFTFYSCANRPWEVFQVLLFPLRDLWRRINWGTHIDIPSFVNSLHLLLSRLLSVCGWKDSGWRLQGFPSTWPSWEESCGFKKCVCRLSLAWRVKAASFFSLAHPHHLTSWTPISPLWSGFSLAVPFSRWIWHKHRSTPSPSLRRTSWLYTLANRPICVCECVCVTSSRYSRNCGKVEKLK